MYAQRKRLNPRHDVAARPSLIPCWDSFPDHQETKWNPQLTSRTLCRGLVLLFMVSVNAALLFEVLDFPALWGLVDAHSLWHAATAPLTGTWYAFIVQDVWHVAGRRKA